MNSESMLYKGSISLKVRAFIKYPNSVELMRTISGGISLYRGYLNVNDTVNYNRITVQQTWNVFRGVYIWFVIWPWALYTVCQIHLCYVLFYVWRMCICKTMSERWNKWQKCHSWCRFNIEWLSGQFYYKSS